MILATNRLPPEAAGAMINTHQFQPPARSGPGQECAGIGARQPKATLAHGDGPGGDLE